MTFECEYCPFRTLDLGKAREHQLESGHSRFSVSVPFGKGYEIEIW